MSATPAICSFWHGEIGPLERLCIASFLEQGHSFDLYAYADPGPLPLGCALRDAAEVIPQDQMFFYKGNRSPAVFADLFRLRLMQHEAGIWADCDMFCVAPFTGLPDHVFGAETLVRGRPRINNAVFRCPPDSPLLDALLGVFAPGAVPPGMPWWRRTEVALRRALGEDLKAEHMQFGATGPWPLNHHVRALGLERFIQPRQVFYPLAYEHAGHLLAPGLTRDDIVGPETRGIHLWHSALTERGSGRMRPPAPGSFLHREMERLGVS